jgi:glycerophosphoryl diester phosphodiesterase
MKIYAHRGYSQKFPEGTKTAYLEAVKAGADGFECDVRLTRDKQIVCFHDRTLRRIVGKAGVISKLSLSELKTKIDILTLEELVDIAISSKKDLLIETKHPVQSGGEVESAVVSLLNSRKAEIDSSNIEIIVMSFSFLAVRRLRKIYPNVMKVIKYRFSLWLNSDTQVAINKELIINRKKNVEKIKAKKVFLWTVNDKTELHSVKQLAGYNVITDCVERAKRELTS